MLSGDSRPGYFHYHYGGLRLGSIGWPMRIGPRQHDERNGRSNTSRNSSWSTTEGGSWIAERLRSASRHGVSKRAAGAAGHATDCGG